MIYAAIKNSNDEPTGTFYEKTNRVIEEHHMTRGEYIKSIKSYYYDETDTTTETFIIDPENGVEETITTGKLKLIYFTLEEEREFMEVSKFQAKAALHHHGYLTQVQEIMNDPTVDPITKLAWEDSQSFKRTSATMMEIATLLGISDSEMDTLFKEAATIEV